MSQGGNHMLSTESGLLLGKYLSSLAKINQIFIKFYFFKFYEVLSRFYQDFLIKFSSFFRHSSIRKHFYILYPPKCE